MNKYNFIITVSTKDALTDYQIYEILHDCRSRLQGYSGDHLETLIKSEMSIKFDNNKYRWKKLQKIKRIINDKKVNIAKKSKNNDTF